ncbi:hypothetical protein PC9H_001517 [Pleurotus ostreatus]|uniref:Metallo-beta-lactamase domain-containing protein n=1 Tax=Pleurotus ostreatus TaxID=5322 RepID=A0A8H7A3X8_PLEOS|nr:uncharacterized protein PC9H_001517 [Pleurotus ostreatus]KAF7441168.1 hypothetical protein PC9H_001517 [Pleurotus ostreatus]KAJ8699331.1 hypothetical protein PTI98_002457 [Pleurotus ostreatus]
MDKLETLGSVSRLSERVVRVLGQNPGKFTLQGTNTYLIGKKNPYILIDTGEGRPEYVPVLESALRDEAKLDSPQDQDISDIIISHWHHDHTDGLPSVVEILQKLWKERNGDAPFKPPRLHKFPAPASATVSPHTTNSLPSIIASLPPGSYTASESGNAFNDLSHGQIVAAPSSTLHVLHTPGHTVDSICLYVQEDKALYTADTILGQGTAVFEDLASYISSLQSLLEFGKSEGHDFASLYPGHGPVVPDGTGLISTYIKHRLEREEQIVQVLRGVNTAEERTAPPQSATTWNIVSVIYAAYPESLWAPAAHSVDLHLKKLEKDGKAKKLGGEGKDTNWQLL